MASISTRKGDDGTTGLLYGQRVEKDHPQIEAVGALDELNTSLGAAKTVLVGHSREAEVRVLLETVQRNLVALMGEIACAESDASRYAASSFIKVAAADIARLDEAVEGLHHRAAEGACVSTAGRRRAPTRFRPHWMSRAPSAAAPSAGSLPCQGPAATCVRSCGSLSTA